MQIHHCTGCGDPQRLDKMPLRVYFRAVVKCIISVCHASQCLPLAKWNAFFFVDKQRFGPVFFRAWTTNIFWGGKVIGSIVAYIFPAWSIYLDIWSSVIRIEAVFPIPVTHLAHQHWSRDGWGGCRMVVWRPREQEKASNGLTRVQELCALQGIYSDKLGLGSSFFTYLDYLVCLFLKWSLFSPTSHWGGNRVIIRKKYLFWWISFNSQMSFNSQISVVLAFDDCQ